MCNGMHCKPKGHAQVQDTVPDDERPVSQPAQLDVGLCQVGRQVGELVVAHLHGQEATTAECEFP